MRGSTCEACSSTPRTGQHGFGRRDDFGATPRSSGTIAVLYADAGPDFGETATALLERQAERLGVRPAETGIEGLAVLSTREFDCVVSDSDMPGENGIEHSNRCPSPSPDLAFIRYTGNGFGEVASEAIPADVTD